MKKNYKLTMTSCFGAYLVQSMVINFIPLLFITFHESFGIPLQQITLLVTVNFITQLIVDFAAAFFIDYIGYKNGAIIAQVFCSLGMVLLAILPSRMGSPFAGLLTSVITYSVGAGLIEVLISPIVESTPSDNKETAMSLLHSFYSWGHVLVVLLTTLFFRLFGIENWQIMALVWAALPACVGVMFCFAPVNHLIGEGEKGMTWKELTKSKLFWVMVLMMICAGASEHAVSQWASAFAEKGLGISKTVGDLAGPLAFAVLMGLSRVIHSSKGRNWDLRKFIIFSTCLCLVSYMLITLVPNPVVNLIGCAICGFAIAIMWPGTLSIAAKTLPRGGTAMFAILALAGDIGCSSGPTLVGFVSGAFGDNLKVGIIAACIFPLLILLCLFKGKLGKKEA
jgi:fucose permease